MKQTAIVALIILCVLFMWVTPVSANSVADSTATLTHFEAETDTRATHLRTYLSTHNSPLADYADHFVSEADRLDLDWRLVAAISGVESTFGKHIPQGSYNAWGWGIPTGAQSGIAFSDWSAGITTVSEGLKTRYVDRGAVTLNQMGNIYAASPVWASKVRFFITKITEFRVDSPELLSITI